jgi:hypothetical protein
MWIAILPFPISLLGHHPKQPVVIALYRIVCTLACVFFTVMRVVRVVPWTPYEKRSISDGASPGFANILVFSFLLWCRRGYWIFLRGVRLALLRGNSSGLLGYRACQTP